MPGAIPLGSQLTGTEEEWLVRAAFGSPRGVIPPSVVGTLAAAGFGEKNSRGTLDVNFENVGGVILDTVLRVMNLHSRIVVCGLIAEYSATEPYGYKMLRSVLVNRIRMQGMIIFDFKDRYSEALKGLNGYLAEGKLKYRESIVEGIDNAPKGFIALLKGENFGKQLVKLA